MGRDFAERNFALCPPRTGEAVVARASRPCVWNRTGETPGPLPRSVGSLDLRRQTPIEAMNRAGSPQIQRRPLMVFSAFRRSSLNLRGRRFMERSNGSLHQAAHFRPRVLARV